MGCAESLSKVPGVGWETISMVSTRVVHSGASVSTTIVGEGDHYSPLSNPSFFCFRGGFFDVGKRGTGLYPARDVLRRTNQRAGIRSWRWGKSDIAVS